MSALVTEPLDTPDDEPELPPLVAAPALGKCTRKPWCVKGAGHKGFCGKAPAGERNADDKPARAKPARRASSSAKSSKPRSSALQPFLGMAWNGLGQLLEAYAPEPAGPPIGRIMQFQSSYAANVLDETLTQHVGPYKAMNKAAGGMLDDLGPLIMPPLLVAIMATGSDGMRMALMPVLAKNLESLALANRAEQLKLQEAMAEAGTQFDQETMDMLNGFVSMLFDTRPHETGDDDAAWPGGQL